MLFELKDIWCHYGGAEILKGVSLCVEKGQIITIIGSNGAGKTTILRTIAGLNSPSSGQILFEGERIDNKPPQYLVKKGIVYVPQGKSIFPYMSVLENLKIGAFLQKDRKSIESELEKVFVHFPVLKERRRQQAKTLSGGEQQMLVIGRALMSKPKLILMDEPSLGLSPLKVQEIGRIVRNINERGISVILVEQNARLALRLASYCYVLEVGNIILQGETNGLLHSEHIKKAYLGK